MVRFARFLEIVHEERMVDNARSVGEHLMRGLESLQKELGGLMTNARGRGLMIAFDLPSPELRGKAHAKIVENGMLL
jgi:L-lysine 6-transaminase